MKRYKLIVNPAAGRGRAVAAAERAAELFKARGAALDLEHTRSPKHAEEIARAALAAYDAVVVVGGDGTVHEVLPALVHSGMPLGIIPAGSGNDLIKALGIPPDNDRAAEIVLAGRSSVIDVGRINGTFFVNVVGMGFDAAVNRASAGPGGGASGIWRYVLGLVRTLGSYEPVPVTLTMNGSAPEEDLFLLTVGNGTTEGGGFRLTPHAKVDDGLLDVTVVRPLSVPLLLWHLPKVFAGTIERARNHARLSRTDRLTVTAGGPLLVHVDGEAFSSKDASYVIEVVPKALTVITGGREENIAKGEERK